jgi:hypothetical protein
MLGKKKMASAGKEVTEVTGIYTLFALLWLGLCCVSNISKVHVDWAFSLNQSRTGYHM